MFLFSCFHDQLVAPEVHPDLTRLLEEDGLEDVPVVADGECFFSWLCLVLGVDPVGNCKHLRKAIAGFMVCSTASKISLLSEIWNVNCFCLSLC